MAREASPWIETAGRIGYLAKGALYALMGVLAFLAATGAGGKTTDGRGSINTLAQQPFGHLVVIALAAALLCYSLFKLSMATLNPERHKAPQRVADAITGFTYGGLFFIALKAALGNPSTQANQQKAAGVMSMPFGVWLVGGFGAVLIGVALFQFGKALTGKFMEVLRTDQMSQDERKTAEISGRIGLISRAVVFGLAGSFLIWAAIDHDPNKAGGLGQALAAIGKLPFGSLLLAMVGLGLVAFALFMAVEAKFRRFVPVQ